MKIAFLGRPDIDEYYSCENLPKLGDKSFITETGMHLGGMVVNAAIVGNKLGAVCSLVYSVSNYEDTTDFILEQLQKYHIQTEYLSTSNRKNKRCIVITSQGEKKGERVIYVVKNDEYPLIKISKKQEKYLLTRDFIYTTITDLELIEESELLCQNISQSAVKLFIDCDNLINSDCLSLLQYANVVSINHFGYQKLIKLGHDAIGLQKKYNLDYVLITHGSKGATLYCSGDRILEQKAFPVKVVNTTGAGDSFNMTFIWGMQHKLPIEKSLELASAVAAYSVQQRGSYFEINLEDIRIKFRL